MFSEVNAKGHFLQFCLANGTYYLYVTQKYHISSYCILYSMVPLVANTHGKCVLSTSDLVDEIMSNVSFILVYVICVISM